MSGDESSGADRLRGWLRGRRGRPFGPPAQECV